MKLISKVKYNIVFCFLFKTQSIIYNQYQIYIECYTYFLKYTIYLIESAYRYFFL